MEKSVQYEDALAVVQGLLMGQDSVLSCAANFSAAVFNELPQISWAGFYFSDFGEGSAAPLLRLGPFMGKPACTRLAPGRGVCGAAAASKKTVVVADVHAFPGHIACDDASASEVVVPLLRPGTGELLGVFDVDSAVTARFDDADARGMEALVAAFAQHCFSDAAKMHRQQICC